MSLRPRHLGGEHLFVPIIFTCMLVAVPAAGTLQIGAKMPDVTLSNPQGQPVALASLQAPVVIIEFWASWCAACREALPAFSALASRYPGQVQLVAINIDRDRDAANQWLERYLPTRTAIVLFDPDNRLMADWGAPGMPTVYVAVGGVIRLVHAGYDGAARDAVEGVVRKTLGALTPSP